MHVNFALLTCSTSPAAQISHLISHWSDGYKMTNGAVWCIGSGLRVFRWFTFSSDQTANPPETLTNQTTRQTSAYMEIVLKKLIYHSKVIHLQIYWFFFLFQTCLCLCTYKKITLWVSPNQNSVWRKEDSCIALLKICPTFTDWTQKHTHTLTHTEHETENTPDYSSRSGHKCSLHSHRLEEVHTRNDLGCVQNNIPAYYTQK